MNSHPSTALAARLPPPTLGGRLRRLLFGVAPSETDFARRGFRLTDPAARQRFTVVVDSFLAGYHAAIEDSEPAALAARLSALPNESCGFAYEGAGMGLALLDALTLSERRLRRFLAGPGDPHEYMVYVGVGWAIARLGRRQHRLERHPTLRPTWPPMAWASMRPSFAPPPPWTARPSPAACAATPAAATIRASAAACGSSRAPIPSA